MATHRADADAGPAGDLVDLGLEAHLGEDGLGGGEHPGPVAAGVGPHRPADVGLGFGGRGGNRNHASDFIKNPEPRFRL